MIAGLADMLLRLTYTEVIGFLAAVLTSVSFMPQVWLTFRTRDVSGVSLGMYSVFTLGVALWLAYGLLLRMWPVVAANALTLTLSLAILAMKLVYGRTDTSRAPDRPPSP